MRPEQTHASVGLRPGRKPGARCAEEPQTVARRGAMFKACHPARLFFISTALCLLAQIVLFSLAQHIISQPRRSLGVEQMLDVVIVRPATGIALLIPGLDRDTPNILNGIVSVAVIVILYSIGLGALITLITALVESVCRKRPSGSSPMRRSGGNK